MSYYKWYAGTGKMYLINAIRNLLQSKCATTGKAAYNVRCVTVHSLLKLSNRTNLVQVTRD